MSDTPKFEVIDRRKLKAEEEETHQPPASDSTPAVEEQAPSAGPQLVVNEERTSAETAQEAPESAASQQEMELPAPPSAEESSKQKAAYDASSQRLEDLVRAQNPGAGAPPPVTFEALVQQFYISAMIQMGAGTQDGQRPRVDILGARSTIDLLGVLAEKTKGNLTDAEDRMLQSVLFDVRMAFLELTSMINMQAMQPPVPPPGKK
jgi:type IV secretory pathway VirB10-like protein